MLERARVQNVRSHRDTEIQFHPFFNVITGDTDSGKSAFIKGLKWCVLNRPTGFEFQSWWVDNDETSSSELEFDGDRAIRRVRNHSINGYGIRADELGFEGQFLQALRGEVPREIFELIRMNELNIHDQHSLYFLLQNTPGEVGSVFNKIANLGVINHYTRAAEQEVRELNNLKISTELEIITLERELENFAFLEQAETLLTEANNEHSIIERMETRKNNLVSIRYQRETVEQRLWELPTLPDPTLLQECVDLDSELNTLDVERARLQWIKDQKARLQTSINEHEQLLQVQETALAEVEELAQQVTRLNNRRNQLALIRNERESLSTRITQADEEFQASVDSYVQALNEYRVCPTCGTEITDECLTHIESEMYEILNNGR